MKLRFRPLWIAVASATSFTGIAGSAPLNEARITHIIRDVKTLDPKKSPRQSTLGEKLRSEQAVRTGASSRAELVFNDNTLTRIGANSHFSFTQGTRNLALDRGVILLQVPKGAGGAQIHTAAVTAGVTGTTILIEAGPGYTKLIVIEGKAYLTARGDKRQRKVIVKAGQELILPNKADKVPPPVEVNLAVLVKTSTLITGQWKAPLHDELIRQSIASQEKRDPIPTNLAIIGPGTRMVFIKDAPFPDQRVASGANPPRQVPPQPPQPPRNPKLGTPTTIAGNYNIQTNTAIQTDPSITTGGVTAEGKNYQNNPLLDGAATPTAYVFGKSTRANPDFDRLFERLNKPAVFRFENLRISGGPSIDTTDGPDELVLASLGSITSPGTPVQTPNGVDLSALKSLTLAALGPISLNYDIALNGGATDLWLTNQGSGADIIFNSEAVLASLRIDTDGNLDMDSFATLGGTGKAGTAELHSGNGTVTITSTIKVSSGSSARQSTRGGTVKVTSGKTTGIAIQSTADINALLASAAPGPGGKIIFTSSGGDILTTGGSLNATRGSVEIRNHGSDGLVHLSGTTLAADVVKVGALGKNGVLRIGGGVISADTTLQLYAGGSNGTVDFVDDVTLSGASIKTIAGKTVNISNGKVVTVNGPAARVFTDNPNYTGSGGNGSRTGTFGGSGASTSPFNHPDKPKF
jgi:hypothetical protein